MKTSRKRKICLRACVCVCVRRITTAQLSCIVLTTLCPYPIRECAMVRAKPKIKSNAFKNRGHSACCWDCVSTTSDRVHFGRVCTRWRQQPTTRNVCDTADPPTNKKNETSNKHRSYIQPPYKSLGGGGTLWEYALDRLEWIEMRTLGADHARHPIRIGKKKKKERLGKKDDDFWWGPQSEPHNNQHGPSFVFSFFCTLYFIFSYSEFYIYIYIRWLHLCASVLPPCLSSASSQAYLPAMPSNEVEPESLVPLHITKEASPFNPFFLFLFIQLLMFTLLSSHFC